MFSFKKARSFSCAKQERFPRSLLRRDYYNDFPQQVYIFCRNLKIKYSGFQKNSSKQTRLSFVKIMEKKGKFFFTGFI